MNEAPKKPATLVVYTMRSTKMAGPSTVPIMTCASRLTTNSAVDHSQMRRGPKWSIPNP